MQHTAEPVQFMCHTIGSVNDVFLHFLTTHTVGLGGLYLRQNVAII